MKKLGFIIGLLVSTTSFYGTAVLADSLRMAPPPQESKLTVVVNKMAIVEPKIEAKVKIVEADQTAALAGANTALEQKVNQKLEALLAAQVLSLETQTLAQQ